MSIIRYEYEGTVIRTKLIDDEPWFVAADVCKALGLAHGRDAVAALDSDEKGVDSIDTLGGKQSVTIINEPGLYSLVLSSRKPEAQAFKRWITHEVLPSIRKTGGYGQQKADDSLSVLVQSTKALASMAEELLGIGRKVDALEERVAVFDTLDITGDDRDKLNRLVVDYAAKAGISFAAAWHEFRRRWDDAYGECLTSRINNYQRSHGIAHMTAPEFLAKTGRMQDALRVAHKMSDEARRRKAA